jgi:hypothetical protein
MGKKSKSSTNSTQTSTPNVPAYLQDTTTDLNKQIQGLSGTDPYSYVAKTNDAQTQALSQAQQLAGSGSSGLFGEVAQGYRDAPDVQSASLLDGLSSYYNPFKDQVLNSTLSDYDANSGRVRAQQAAGAAGTGAFGGSRYGVREAQTEGELARGRASTESGLLSDMYNSATGLSNSDAARRQSASESNANLALQRAGGLASVAGAQDANTRANTGLLEGLGNDQYTRDTTTAQAPLDLLKTQTGLFQGLDPSSYFGNTTTGNSTTKTSQSDPLGSIGQALKVAGTAAVLFSDQRLKDNIELVGRDPKGRNVYDYDYLWEPGQRRRGYMAQELAKSDPQAVRRHGSGFLQVDYEAVR